MVDRRTRPIGRISKKYTFIFLAVLSGIIGAIWIAIDTYTGAAIVLDEFGEPNEYAFAIQSMWIGLAVSFIFVLILWIPISSKPLKKSTKTNEQKENNHTTKKSEKKDEKAIEKVVIREKTITKQKRRHSFLGQFLDPQYNGVRLPTKKMLLWLFLSGFFAGIRTIIYFILIKDMDLPVFLSASQFVVIYLLIGDLIIERSFPCAVEIQAIIMIILGVIVAAIDISQTASSGSFNWLSLLLVFLVLNTSAAIYVIFQKKAVETKDEKGKTMDSTNVRFWTLIFMAIFTTLFSLPFMGREGWRVLKNTFVQALLPIAISMFLVFIARILYVRALAMGKMSIVNSLASISVIAGIPITLICSFIWPDYFLLPSGNLTWVVWLLRGIGAILVFVGIVSLSMSEVKLMIMAKIAPGEVCDIAKIKNISGVERVSAVTGRYDLLIFVRFRTIGKGYQPIVEQLAKIPCITGLVTSSILKEWVA